jgi:hypothetical protein
LILVQQARLMRGVVRVCLIRILRIITTISIRFFALMRRLVVLMAEIQDMVIIRRKVIIPAA